jgi:hypothetical protein
MLSAANTFNALKSMTHSNIPWEGGKLVKCIIANFVMLMELVYELVTVLNAQVPKAEFSGALADSLEVVDTKMSVRL